MNLARAKKGHSREVAIYMELFRPDHAPSGNWSLPASALRNVDVITLKARGPASYCREARRVRDLSCAVQRYSTIFLAS